MTGERISIKINEEEMIDSLILKIKNDDLGKTIPLDEHMEWGFFSMNQTDADGERSQIDNSTKICDIVKSDTELTELYALPYEYRCCMCGLDIDCRLYQSDIMCPSCIEDINSCTEETLEGYTCYMMNPYCQLSWCANCRMNAGSS